LAKTRPAGLARPASLAVAPLTRPRCPSATGTGGRPVEVLLELRHGDRGVGQRRQGARRAVRDERGAGRLDLPRLPRGGGRTPLLWPPVAGRGALSALLIPHPTPPRALGGRLRGRDTARAAVRRSRADGDSGPGRRKFCRLAPPSSSPSLRMCIPSGGAPAAVRPCARRESPARLPRALRLAACSSRRQQQTIRYFSAFLCAARLPLAPPPPRSRAQGGSGQRGRRPGARGRAQRWQVVAPPRRPRVFRLCFCVM